MVWYGMVYGMVWHGVWYGMVYGMVWLYCIEGKFICCICMEDFQANHESMWRALSLVKLIIVTLIIHLLYSMIEVYLEEQC